MTRRLVACGMKVLQLIVRHPESITDELACQTFLGLRELDLQLQPVPVPFNSLSWFREFASAHPLLKKIRFIDVPISLPNCPTLPFITSFVDDTRNERLADACSITHFSITRQALSSEWLVTGLKIVIKSSLLNQGPFFPSFFISSTSSVDTRIPKEWHGETTTVSHCVYLHLGSNYLLNILLVI